MSSGFFVDRYRRYKRGTEKLVEWLRQSGQGAPKENGSGIKSSQSLQTQELLALAKYICNSDPPIEVPAEILHVLADIIDGRSSAADWYSAVEANGGQKDSVLGKSNKKHRHFIGVLRQVQTLLKNFVRSISANGPSGHGNDIKFEERNLFAFLELEESDESVMSVDTTKTSTKPKKDHKAEAAKVSDRDQDLSFRIYCYLRDLQDIRKYLKEVWNRYYEGEITFQVATQVTEVAFRLLLDIRDTFEDMDGYDELVYFLGLRT